MKRCLPVLVIFMCRQKKVCGRDQLFTILSKNNVLSKVVYFQLKVLNSFFMHDIFKVGSYQNLELFTNSDAFARFSFMHIVLKLAHMSRPSKLPLKILNKRTCFHEKGYT